MGRGCSNRYRQAEKKERERDKRKNKEPGDTAKGMNVKHEKEGA